MNVEQAAFGNKAGESVAKRSELTARDLIVETLKAIPKGPRGLQFSHFQELLANSPEYQRSVDWYFFSNMITYLTGTRVSRGGPADDKVDHGSYKRAVEDAQNRIKEDIKAKIVLLNLPMPNGKSMRECSGQEMASFGAGYKRIADKVGKAKLVGAVLKEDDVRALLAAVSA